MFIIEIVLKRPLKQQTDGTGTWVVQHVVGDDTVSGAKRS